MQTRIAIIGECMVELQGHGETLSQSFGGDTLNTAIYLSSLSEPEQVQVSFITAVGTDSFSRQMLAQWQEYGIDTRLVFPLKNKLPGIYHIENDTDGERRFSYWRNSSAARFVFDNVTEQELSRHLSKFDWVYLSGVTLAVLSDTSRERLMASLARFRQKGGMIAFDNNYRPALWPSIDLARATYRHLLSLTDTAFLTFDDEQALFGDHGINQCIARSRDHGIREIVIKRGAKDCLIITGQNVQSVAAENVHRIIDTTAAGDSFSAGYLTARFKGYRPGECAELGHQLAAKVIQFKGAIIPRSKFQHLSKDKNENVTAQAI